MPTLRDGLFHEITVNREIAPSANDGSWDMIVHSAELTIKNDSHLPYLINRLAFIGTVKEIQGPVLSVNRNYETDRPEGPLVVPARGTVKSGVLANLLDVKAFGPRYFDGEMDIVAEVDGRYEGGERGSGNLKHLNFRVQPRYKDTSVFTKLEV